jgi:hypothetical protein
MLRQYKKHVVLASISALLSCAAQATEHGQLRALLGLPGQDLTSPALPGLYLQTNYQHYSADSFKDKDGNTPVQSGNFPPLGVVQAQQDSSVRADVLALRASWVSESQLWDGRLGVSATLPIVKTHIETRLNRLTQLPATIAPVVDAALAKLSAANSGDETGLGDMEIAPFIDWQTETYRILFAPAFVAPTGSYDANRAVNPGAGNFWTIRPALTLAYVTENGIELGARTTYSFNTRNQDTEYKSGQYLHSDGAVMYQVRDGLRVGAAGYLVWQTTKDSGVGAPEDGNKARVFALGPSIGWQSEDSTIGVEFKVLQEFGAQNRPEGTLGWLRLIYRAY